MKHIIFGVIAVSCNAFSADQEALHSFKVSDGKDIICTPNTAGIEEEKPSKKLNANATPYIPQALSSCQTLQPYSKTPKPPDYYETIKKLPPPYQEAWKPEHLRRAPPTYEEYKKYRAEALRIGDFELLRNFGIEAKIPNSANIKEK